jgi:hypothetical protein
MVEPRAPVSTVTFIDNYCAVYRDLFADVRLEGLSVHGRLK